MTHRLVVSILLMAMLACFPLIFVCVFFAVRSYFHLFSLHFDYYICLVFYMHTHIARQFLSDLSIGSYF